MTSEAGLDTFNQSREKYSYFHLLNPAIRQPKLSGKLFTQCCTSQVFTLANCDTWSSYAPYRSDLLSGVTEKLNVVISDF